MALDLGGIGKGFALDRMVAALKDQHISRALLDFGQSSQWAVGTPPNAAGWRLLIRQSNGQVAGLMTLQNQALSVSGSLGQSVTVGGQRYGHVIDPRTGQPIQRDLLAYVVAPSAAQAEALSKAFLILGESEGTALLERLPGVQGMLLEANTKRWQTAGWTQSVSFVSF
jgi:thiamine biosynthesis lipoprotein